MRIIHNYVHNVWNYVAATTTCDYYIWNKKDTYTGLSYIYTSITL